MKTKTKKELTRTEKMKKIIQKLIAAQTKNELLGARDMAIKVFGYNWV